MVDWTIKELRELLEMIEENGDGDRIIRFDYDGEKYQLDWPVAFERGTVKRELFSMDEEVIYVNKDTADFRIIPDDRNLSNKGNLQVFVDSLEEVRQMLTDGKLYKDELKEGAYKNFLKYENSHFHFDDSTRKAAEKLGIPVKILSAVIYCYTIHDTHNLRIIKYHCLKTMSYEEWNELTMEAREQASRLTWADL